MLDDAQTQLQAACQAIPHNGEKLPLVERFEWIDWNTTSAHVLNRHRRHLTKWFWTRTIDARKIESRRNIILVVVGAMAFALLIASAMIGALYVPPTVGLGVAVLLWIPVIDIMGSTWLDDHDLRKLIQWTEPRERREPSSAPFDGMIYAMCNEIRRRYGKKYISDTSEHSLL
ncbi:hypothetical protein GR217_22730 [Rhizobium leguminosarum]|uniref:Uncharacterized protein n=1 Tax=Rhizobium ruizarguesonis TaxID=2081791 RepID=A0AAE5C2E5_9HYPH|nr:hypothetical protein [Rhizobium ruizarguesonis]NEI50503.1 hypothetical protein [Rhizobium ruizarguesonis]